MCLPKWKEVIFNTFGINMKMHYGQVEKVSFAHQDNYDDIYKENLLYGYNEFDENNTIIGTGFYNQLMPLIRYKTNDVVKLKENVKLDNSTPKTILEILGRNGDMLISEKDSMVPAVNFYSFMSKIEEVDLFQIIQVKETKDINFYIVPNLKFTNDSENRLLIEMKNRLGNVNIKIIKVDSLVRDKISNKLKTISLI
jgi:phenylacetate-CoA ligase